MIRDEASERQVRAADPRSSTWLSANAGSGKTRVLTDRVARLLLDGVSPDHILCLTYTKAAASEMQNRLFRRLGEWAMKPDAELEQALIELGVEGPYPPARLGQARTLFARAIETPGGLKIQTIHSFCSALLRRFPLEAGVSPQFAEMEDRAAALLRNEIVEEMAEGADRARVEEVAAWLTDEDFERITSQIAGNRPLLETIPDEDALFELFGLAPGTTEESIAGQVFLGGEEELLSRVGEALKDSSANDQKAAEKITALPPLGFEALEDLESICLFGATAASPFGAKIGKFPTKKGQALIGPDLHHRLDQLMARVEVARDARCALVAARKTRALHRFAEAFLPRYEEAKQARGWLDFDDLITLADRLLANEAVAQWVLFRLDGEIDHLLVDEAQDTSPVQWQVIDRLTREFAAGSGQRADVMRTIFVVGDKKQSIYSFQGADPREFDRMKADFAERYRAIGAPFADLTLEFSFRSAQAVLQLVDECFATQVAAGFDPDQPHRAFKDRMPGRVDLWPAIAKEKDEDETPWYEPVDRPGPSNPAVVLATRVADELKRMFDDGVRIPDEEGGAWGMRPLTPGDVMILVQRRGPVFHEIIRACKSAGLPIAGADRLRIGAELAVRDLAALLRFLATPEDDLSLAEALKSPLFGWSEQALFSLAHGRPGYLWQALRERTDHPETLAILHDLRGQTDYLRPYDLIERILTRHDGRRRLLARLGAEAEDGINALLSQALAFERNAIPSLTGFLLWMETDDLEIKRQMDSAGDRIRVMTVHGAKGLEAPLVILPDCARRQPRAQQGLLPAAGTALWSVPAASRPRLMDEAAEARREAERAERERLLYVAMTRAEKWLIVAAAGEIGKAEEDSWYNRISTALDMAGAVPADLPGGEGKRFETGDWALPAMGHPPSGAAVPPALDPLYSRPAPPPPERPAALTP
ncbi:double-strand break repair helicase AddA, partial [Aquicoccus sp. SCR17]|nr:double-strand break repair helicase AddA [Carideicomes alvinocaridis]